MQRRRLAGVETWGSRMGRPSRLTCGSAEGGGLDGGAQPYMACCKCVLCVVWSAREECVV